MVLTNTCRRGLNNLLHRYLAEFTISLFPFHKFVFKPVSPGKCKDVSNKGQWYRPWWISYSFKIQVVEEENSQETDDEDKHVQNKHDLTAAFNPSGCDYQCCSSPFVV